MKIKGAKLRGGYAVVLIDVLVVAKLCYLLAALAKTPAKTSFLWPPATGINTVSPPWTCCDNDDDGGDPSWPNSHYCQPDCHTGSARGVKPDMHCALCEHKPLE